MKCILASQSPRRRELMEHLDIPFTVCPADIDETMDLSRDPRQEVARVSLHKARAVPAEPQDVVIGADTIVVCDGRVLGKPHSPQEAEEMLRLLSGRTHEVMTGLSVIRGSREKVLTQVTKIRFRQLSDREIFRYVAGGEPMDKAGAYGIQGGAALFVEEIQGDYFNVVGLPLCPLGQILEELAPELWEAQP